MKATLVNIILVFSYPLLLFFWDDLGDKRVGDIHYITMYSIIAVLLYDKKKLWPNAIGFYYSVIIIIVFFTNMLFDEKIKLELLYRNTGFLLFSGILLTLIFFKHERRANN
jgi:hypothetical protein